MPSPDQREPSVITFTHARFFCFSGVGETDDPAGQQQLLVGTSDWPADFEAEASLVVPPKAMPELYVSQGEQVCCW